MIWPEKAESLYRSMKNEQIHTTEQMLDGMIYAVATHFKISMAEARRMSEEDFATSFVWATAVSRVQSDEMDEATGDMKSGQRVDKTGTGQPFPGSEGW